MYIYNYIYLFIYLYVYIYIYIYIYLYISIYIYINHIEHRPWLFASGGTCAKMLSVPPGHQLRTHCLCKHSLCNIPNWTEPATNRKAHPISKSSKCGSLVHRFGSWWLRKPQGSKPGDSSGTPTISCAMSRPMATLKLTHTTAYHATAWNCDVCVMQISIHPSAPFSVSGFFPRFALRRSFQ